MFSLDTNVVIAVTTRRGPDVKTRLESELALGTRIWLSTIVLFELRYGAAKSERPG